MDGWDKNHIGISAQHDQAISIFNSFINSVIISQSMMFIIV